MHRKRLESFVIILPIVYSFIFIITSPPITLSPLRARRNLKSSLLVIPPTTLNFVWHNEIEWILNHILSFEGRLGWNIVISCWYLTCLNESNPWTLSRLQHVHVHTYYSRCISWNNLFRFIIKALAQSLAVIDNYFFNSTKFKVNPTNSWSY